MLHRCQAFVEPKRDRWCLGLRVVVDFLILRVLQGVAATYLAQRRIKKLAPSHLMASLIFVLMFA